VLNEGVGSWTARRARKTPDARAILHEGRTLTYAGLHDRAGRLARALRGLGAGPGTRVAYLGPNHPAFLETMFAAWSAGAVFVPLNMRLAGPELAYQLGDCGAALLVYAPGQAAVVAAWILPEVVIGFAWFAYLDRDAGTLNGILGALGLPGADWLLDMPFLAIVVFNTWRGTAFSMMLFSSALQSIPPSYFETADVVGASSWQKLRDIALPLIRGHVVTDLILVTMWTFNVFTPFLLTAGGPSFRTEILSIYTYQLAFKHFEFGRGAVPTFVNFPPSFVSSQ